jgi:hypothetical protein
MTTLFETSGVLITAIATALLTWVTYLLWRLGKEAGVTSRAQLRAYVFVQVAICKIDNGKVGAKIKFKNFGATPAFKVKVRFDVVPENALSNLTLCEPEPEFALAPGASMTVSHAKSENDFFEGGRIHAVGQIDYIDSFGEAHRTNFKMRYVESAVTSDAGLQPTADGNDAN